MILKIGEKIKQLRKEKDITQEELANVLGVSYQSVSRWENETCYPDIELLPTISNFFGISIDSIFSINEIEEKSRIEKYVAEFQKAISDGQINDCISIARKGVAEFPNNYILLNKLMYALFVAGDNTGNIPNWEENDKKYDEEITMLGERIIKYCPDQEIRLEATARLAFNHCEHGRKQLGRAIYETLPSWEYGKENQMWWALEDNEQLLFVRNKIQKSAEFMNEGLRILVSRRLLSDKDLLIVFEKQFELQKILYDDLIDYTVHGNAYDYIAYAQLLMRTGNKDECFIQLKNAVECAKYFDDRPEIYEFESLLLGKQKIRKTDYDTCDTRCMCKIISDDYLTHKDFDKIRNEERFIKIVNELKQNSK